MGLDEGIPDRISIPISLDSEGFLGRECPECEAYFKITPGTGLSGIEHCICPYCGVKAAGKSFYTKDQIEHAKSVAMNQFSSVLLKNLKYFADDFPSSPGGFLRIKMEAEGQPTEVISYSEKDLETTLECASCNLRYAIYGLFANCPDCGSHNSLQILEKNLELAQKLLGAFVGPSPEVAQSIHEAALTQVVSAFDGFGREVTRQFDQHHGNVKPSVSSFQSIAKARARTITAFQYDLADGILEEEWTSLCRLFQKRHLIAHRLGVVDDEYIEATADPTAIVGRKVEISPEEIPHAISVLLRVGTRMLYALEVLKSNK